ncbi:MAG: hypothetical protein RIQ94_3375, partial [Pseudomonadota bacterium]
LRTALAISQGVKLLSTLQQEAEGTVSHDQTKRVTYLTELFSRIHREMFQDWKEQPTICHRPGSMADPEKRKEFREAIERLVLDGDDNNETAIFDNNGFVISTENIAERLASFYQKMRCVRPFYYGNRLTLDFFITMLGKLPAIKSVYEQGIDFRRINVCDAVALHNPDSTLREEKLPLPLNTHLTLLFVKACKTKPMLMVSGRKTRDLYTEYLFCRIQRQRA